MVIVMDICNGFCVGCGEAWLCDSNGYNVFVLEVVRLGDSNGYNVFV